MVGKQPRQVARTNPKFLGQRGNIIPVQSSGLDECQGPLDGRPRTFPGGTERRGLGPATQTGAKPGPFRGGRAWIEHDIACERGASRAHRTTIDPGCLDGDEDDTVKGRIAP
jgi:hypothetical protein